MPPKRSSGPKNSEKKRMRREKKWETMSLVKKIEILDKLRAGARVNVVGHEYGVNESTIRTIRKGKESVRARVMVASNASLTIKRMTRADVQLNKTEALLNTWIEDLTQKRAPLCGTVINEKVQKLYAAMCEKEGEPFKRMSFSSGWLDNFRKYFNIRNVTFTGESASADHQAAELFPAELAEIIEDNDYKPQQAFNADETSFVLETNAIHNLHHPAGAFSTRT